MNNIIEAKIQNRIYEIREKQLMLDSEISRTKYHNYFYVMMITHYAIGSPMAVFVIM